MDKTSEEKCAIRLNPCAFGLAIGITWGLGTLLLSYIAIWFGIGSSVVVILGDIYLGYEPTYLGGLIGLAWGFIDGFIFGLIVAYIYNLIGKCHKCPMCCPSNK